MLSRGLRRWLISAAVVVVLIGAYATFGFFGVPRLLRSNLDSFVSTHYSRSVSIGDIRFNPFTLTLEIRAFSLPDADGQPMLGFSRLFVNLGIVSLWRRGPSFQEIALEDPFERVADPPGRHSESGRSGQRIRDPAAAAEPAARSAAAAVHRQAELAPRTHRLRRPLPSRSLRRGADTDHLRPARLQHDGENRQRVFAGRGDRGRRAIQLERDCGDESALLTRALRDRSPAGPYALELRARFGGIRDPLGQLSLWQATTTSPAPATPSGSASTSTT